MEKFQFEMTTDQLETSVNSILKHCFVDLSLNPIGASFVLQHTIDFLKIQHGVVITSSDFIPNEAYGKPKLVR